MTACPACGSPAPLASLRVPDYEYCVSYVAAYASCPACASVFQHPMPQAVDLASFYPPHYHSRTGSGPWGSWRHALRLKRLARLVRDGMTVVDFGCGNGDFLLYAARALPGLSYVGYEIGLGREVRELAGAVTLVTGSLEDLARAAAQCSLITMNHVVEHLPDPLAVLRTLCGMLAPGGFIEGQTPAAGSLEHRVFGARWSGYHAPRHTVVFSSQGLEGCLKRAGFESVRVTAAFNPAALAVSLAAALGPSSPNGLPRRGLRWQAWLAAGALLAPVERLCKSPGVVDFLAEKSR